MFTSEPRSWNFLEIVYWGLKSCQAENTNGNSTHVGYCSSLIDFGIVLSPVTLETSFSSRLLITKTSTGTRMSAGMSDHRVTKTLQRKLGEILLTHYLLPCDSKLRPYCTITSSLKTSMHLDLLVYQFSHLLSHDLSGLTIQWRFLIAIHLRCLDRYRP